MSFSFRIKICGITSVDVARAATDAGADYLGLVFSASPRGVTLARASALVAAVPADWVGVFVDAPCEEIARAALELGLCAVQLHGGERPEECRTVRERTGVPVWKAIVPLGDRNATAFEAVVDALLFDGGTGGTGRTLDWREVGSRYPVERRIVPHLLAGGLDPENVARAIEQARPDGVDASSRLEIAPGVKEPRLVSAFVRRARAAHEAAGESGTPAQP